MRRIVPLVLALALPGLAPASSWELDPAHTAVQFAIRHLMVSTVRGRFDDVKGTVTLDEADPTKSSVAATIEAASIDTGNAKRDAHLREPDFLDVARYPQITFTSKRVAAAGENRWKVTGDLTLHGVTKEVVLDVEGSPKPTSDGRGNPKLGGIATTKIKRSDFGVTWNKPLDMGGVVLGDELNVTIDVELNPLDEKGT
jgi:polyisoprenoid-binding protein YceI